MSKTIEEINTKELLGKVALANGYSCMAEMSVTNSDKDIRIAVLKYQLEESQSQTQELVEQNREIVEELGFVLNVLKRVSGFGATTQIIEQVEKVLSKYKKP